MGDPRFSINEMSYDVDKHPATRTPCKDLPNVNEMTWYAKYGDPRWDADELWSTMGHLYKGGIWFKKKSQISGYNPNTAVYGGDWSAKTYTASWNASNTLPSAADAGNYFYLPTLGYYYDGKLFDVGSKGWYWSSSAKTLSSTYVYSLCISSGMITLYFNTFNTFGCRVDGFE